jgi:hypothetical protein
MTTIETPDGDSLPVRPEDAMPMSREETVDFALLGIAARLAELQPSLRASDFQRLPSLRAFTDAGACLIRELKYGDS